MSNTSFIRTSEERHHSAVKHFWVSNCQTFVPWAVAGEQAGRQAGLK